MGKQAMKKTFVGKFSVCLALVGVLALSPMAVQAGPILTFGFTDLDTDYNHATGEFTAVSDGATNGEVSRVVAPVGTATYNADFTGGVAAVDFALTISNVTANSADGVGSLTIWDLDGDSLTADLDGSWTLIAGFGFYTGYVSDFYLNELGDGLFEGPTGGDFSMDFDAYVQEPYGGAMQFLGLEGGWFGASYENLNIGAQGSILPEPATCLLLGVGLVAVGRRGRQA